MVALELVQLQSFGGLGIVQRRARDAAEGGRVDEDGRPLLVQHGVQRGACALGLFALVGEAFGFAEELTVAFGQRGNCFRRLGEQRRDQCVERLVGGIFRCQLGCLRRELLVL